MGDKPDCKDCYALMSKVDVKLEVLNKNIMKVVYALLAAVGANIGTEYIGTPVHVHVAIYALFFASVFVFAITLWKWKCFGGWDRFIRMSFVAGSLYVCGLRIYHYQINTPLTKTEGFIDNILSLCLAIGFIGLAWSKDSAR